MARYISSSAEPISLSHHVLSAVHCLLTDSGSAGAVSHRCHLCIYRFFRSVKKRHRPQCGARFSTRINKGMSNKFKVITFKNQISLLQILKTLIKWLNFSGRECFCFFGRIYFPRKALGDVKFFQI